MMKQSTFQIERAVARRQGSREHQEDEYDIQDGQFESTGVALFSVFDGHGSTQYSAHAAVNLNRLVMSDPHFAQHGYEQALRSAFIKENGEMKQGLYLKGVNRGGCTATVALLADNKLFVANVGDSTCVVAERQPDGALRARLMSKDHKVADRDERLRVERAGGTIEKDRVVAEGRAINMTRALGDFQFKSPENDSGADFISATPSINIIDLEANKHEFLIVASDGLWTAMNPQQVVDCIHQLRCNYNNNIFCNNLSADAITKSLTASIAKETYSDNITVILVVFHWLADTATTAAATATTTAATAETTVTAIPVMRVHTAVQQHTPLSSLHANSNEDVDQEPLVQTALSGQQ